MAVPVAEPVAELVADLSVLLAAVELEFESPEVAALPTK